MCIRLHRPVSPKSRCLTSQVFIYSIYSALRTPPSRRCNSAAASATARLITSARYSAYRPSAHVIGSGLPFERSCLIAGSDAVMLTALQPHATPASSARYSLHPSKKARKTLGVRRGASRFRGPVSHIDVLNRADLHLPHHLVRVEAVHAELLVCHQDSLGPVQHTESDVPGPAMFRTPICVSGALLSLVIQIWASTRACVYKSHTHTHAHTRTHTHIHTYTHSRDTGGPSIHHPGGGALSHSRALNVHHTCPCRYMCTLEKA